MAAAKPAAEKKGGGGGFMSTVLAFLILTGLGVGGGGLFGLQVAQKVSPKAADHAAADAHAHAAAPADNHGAKDPHAKDKDKAKMTGPRLVNLPNIITNLAQPEKMWVRIEGALIVEGENAEAMAGIVAEDIVAYLRTVSLDQIQGGSGYQYLREDLNERARVRGQGKVKELVLQSLILE